jgi:hypothetical protein
MRNVPQQLKFDPTFKSPLNEIALPMDTKSKVLMAPPALHICLTDTALPMEAKLRNDVMPAMRV